MSEPINLGAEKAVYTFSPENPPALVVRSGSMLEIETRDVHASMGFCEVHSGVNIDAIVRLRIAHVFGAGWDRPWFETTEEIMTIVVENHLEDAIREVTRGMVGLIFAARNCRSWIRLMRSP